MRVPLRKLMAMAAVLLFVSAAPAPAGGDADPGSPQAAVKDPMLARILEQWDKRQQETHTLVATFTERK
jgi:hypothetical protein